MRIPAQFHVVVWDEDWEMVARARACPLSVLKTVLANVERSKLVLQRPASDALWASQV